MIILCIPLLSSSLTELLLDSVLTGLGVSVALATFIYNKVRAKMSKENLN